MSQHQLKVDIIDQQCLEGITPKLYQFFPQTVADKFVKQIPEALSEDMFVIDLENLEITLEDDHKIFTICSGLGNHRLILNSKDEGICFVTPVGKQYLDKLVTVSVIDARVIEDAIKKYVGNKGVDTDCRKAGLKILLEATMEYILKHNVANIWENATVTIYDLKDNTFKFQSGSGKNKFIVAENEGTTIVKYTVNNQVKEISRPNATIDIISTYCERLLQFVSFGHFPK